MSLKCAKVRSGVTLFALNSATFAHAQFGRGGGDWLAVGGDAQRTASVKTDPQISVESVQAGVMQSLWKLKLNGAPTPPVIASRLITYKGFKDLLYVGTSADNVVSIDHTVGKIFWETHLAVRFVAGSGEERHGDLSRGNDGGSFASGSAGASASARASRWSRAWWASGSWAG